MASNFEEESLTQEEWELGDSMWRWFRRGATPPKPQVGFGELLEGLAAPNALEILADYPERWRGVSDLVVEGRLQSFSYLPYLKFLHENRERILRKELVTLWNFFLNVGDDYVETPHEPMLVETFDGDIEVCRIHDAYLRAKGGDRVATVEQLRDSLATNPLFVDHPKCCYRYCVLQKPGWELFRYAVGRKRGKFRLTPQMAKALLDDDAASFVIALDISGMAGCYSLLWIVLCAGATNVLTHLLESGRIAQWGITLPEICCLLVADFTDEQAIKILGALEKWRPGTLGGVHDAFGRNLLWYTVHNRKTVWFADDFGIAHFLMTHGCTPKNTNQAGLTWRELCVALTPELKNRYIQRREFEANFSRGGWKDWWKRHDYGHSRWKAPTP